MNLLPRKFIYRLYERKLAAEIRNQPIPEHIAIILDGNRRGSQKLGVEYEEGYHLGAQKLEEVLDWCWELGVKIITCWVFSTDNFTRPDSQVKSIMQLAKEYLQKFREDKRVHNNQIQLKVLGRINLLPSEVQEEIKKTEKATGNYNKFRFNLCMAYGGRAEIVDALKDIIVKAKNNEIDLNDVNEDLIASHLYTVGVPDPDLIIRSSGEERLSGFLLWQAAYSEYYFADVFWPLFRKIDLWRAIRTFQGRKRRYGK